MNSPSDNIPSTAARCVSLVNHYLAGIHAGIQTSHAVSKLQLAYLPGSPAFVTIEGWDASGSPWMDLFNGGFASHLEESAQAIEAINAELANNPHPSLPGGIPFARFHEGIAELNGALTCVVMILPGDLVSIRDEFGDLPPDFAFLLSRSRKRRAQVAVERTDLPLSWRLAMLFEGLAHAR